MKAPNRKMRFHFAKFVNLPGFHSTGYIFAYVVKARKGWYSGEKSYPRDVEAGLSFKDCDREINFSFELRTDEEFANSMHKLDTMIEGLKGLKKALVAENKQRIRETEDDTSEDE